MWGRTLLVALAAGLPATAAAATIEGTVFFDRDGDGLFSAGDDPVPGARVAWGTRIFATCDAAGQYTITVPDGAGILWVSVPEGGVPGPRWESISASGTVGADLAIEPLEEATAAAPLTFVVAADAHLDGVVNTHMIDDLAVALDQALALSTPPRFFTVVGDITQANRPDDFDGVDAILAGFATPWVPVPGNHDWYDGGAAYRARWGPDMYSFTTGGAHFIVWNSEVSIDTAVAFLMDDLAGLDPATTVVAFGHKPQRDDIAAVMRAAGVDYLFTGHWHASRAIDHGGMLELTTQPLLFGGVDLTPAGYRVVTLDDGAMSVDLHAFVDEPVAQIVWPRADTCARPGDAILAAVEAGARQRAIEILVDGERIAAEPAGGWLWTAPLPSGARTVELVIRDDAGEIARTSTAVETCAGDDADADTVLAVGEWTQQQGGPEHPGAVATPVPPPLAHAWIAAIGSHLHQAAPVVGGGRVFMTYGDFVANGGGGVVALDARTGEERWRATPGRVRNSAAVAGDTVVVGTTAGVLVALDAATGATRWTVDLGEGVDATQSSLWAAPTIRDGVVYAGVQRHVAAVDLATGAVLWSDDPDPEGVWLGSYGALAVTDELVIGTFNRTAGLIAWGRADGVERWRVADAATKAVNGAPLVDETRVVVGNAGGEVTAFDLATGERVWQTVVADASDWDYAITSNLAVAEGRILVATQAGSLHALASSDGAPLWSYDARTGPMRTANFRGIQPGFQASPVVAGDLVWIADASGLLVALDLVTGEEWWRIDLGVPVLGGLAAAGDLLLVPSWDGALHALAPTGEPLVGPPGAGCCSAGRPRGGDGVLALAVLALLLRRRTPRPPGRGRSRSCPCAPRGRCRRRCSARGAARWCRRDRCAGPAS